MDDERYRLIGQVLDKMDEFHLPNVIVPERIDLFMSLDFSPLKVEHYKKLLEFRKTDVIHDVLGINAHIDRGTKVLNEFFVPRCMSD